MTSWVLGLNGPPIGWHDAAACLISGDGTVVAYSEEERFNRKKHSPYEPPRQSAQFCLDTAGITLADVDVVAYGWDLPHMWPRYGHTWEGQDTIDQMLGKWLGWKPGDQRPEVVFVQHHHAHACSTFYGSPYEEAAILINDGNGEDESISLYSGSRDKGPVFLHSWPRSHSLGYLYDATSRACGMSFLEAGKTMGLAAFGAARGVEPWPTMRFDGDLFEPPFSFDGNPDYKQVVGAWLGVFEQYGSFPVETATSRLVDDEAAVRIAWSAQAGVEEAIARLAAHARRETGIDALCMAGGVALNCSANGKLPEPVYVPPVPHDAGVALGAAWSVCPPTGPPAELSPYLGLAIDPSEVGATLEGAGLGAPIAATTEAVVERLRRGLVGAIAHGRAEVGPRALCHRSLLAVPDAVSVRDDVNKRKGRELWRPLSPVALASTGGDLWPSRPSLHHYMLGATQVADERRARVPAVVHVDGTARVQAIEEGEPVADYLRALESAGLPPVLINTSFNTRGEPVVNTAAEALSSAQAIGVDFLVLEDQLVDLDGYSRS
jgi:carbamoyltransferase